ncbi:hypothetical protein H2198_008827 [Neophaeococcomyces mojaviensis]|uniref:Uncharacterized protein n=1 Tax=Neophaeococcomyces mojaviensis TaxID=3383035 RepID=A0ACC2ZWD0_9EURO|nr:hypothetical protein H2198_008827 [Knufia sp. JES_112]
MTHWISFPERFGLQDVQAYLNVLISFLCAGATFVLVRVYWQTAARRLLSGERVLARSLFSPNTIGETIDLLALLGKDIFSRPFYKTLIQVLLVACFTLAALLSGVIARYFTQNGIIEVPRNITGVEARRSTSNTLRKSTQLHNTMSDLNRANVSLFELLNFLPDRTEPWMYRSNQWPNAYHLECVFKPAYEMLNVQAVNNCTSTNSLYAQIPTMQSLWTTMPDAKLWAYSYDSTYRQINSTATTFPDVFIFQHGIAMNRSDANSFNNATFMASRLRLRTIFIHLQEAPRNSTTNTTTLCPFGVGAVPKATLTEFICNVTRDTSQVRNASMGAYPEAFNAVSISSAYSERYSGSMLDQRTLGQNVTMVAGEELLRFYQSYLVVKDTGTSGVYGSHLLNVQVTVAQVSIFCLIFCIAGILVVLAGLAIYAWFIVRHWEFLDIMPQSKLDWMLRSLNSDVGEAQRTASGVHIADLSPDEVIRERFKHGLLMSDVPIHTRSFSEDETAVVSGNKRAKAPVSVRVSRVLSTSSESLNGIGYAKAYSSIQPGWIAQSPSAGRYKSLPPVPSSRRSQGWI